jgi:NADH:ubiquinone oxidoreductase subunit 4 (subunit M)
LFLKNSFVVVCALLATIPGAAYNIWLFARVFYGPVNEFIVGFADVNEREISVFFLLLFVVMLMGLNPGLFLTVITRTTVHLHLLIVG